MIVSSGSKLKGSDLELRQSVNPAKYTVVPRCYYISQQVLWAHRVLNQVEISNFLERPRQQKGGSRKGGGSAHEDD